MDLPHRALQRAGSPVLAVSRKADAIREQRDAAKKKAMELIEEIIDPGGKLHEAAEPCDGAK